MYFWVFSNFTFLFFSIFRVPPCSTAVAQFAFAKNVPLPAKPQASVDRFVYLLINYLIVMRDKFLYEIIPRIENIINIENRIEVSI